MSVITCTDYNLLGPYVIEIYVICYVMIVAATKTGLTCRQSGYRLALLHHAANMAVIHCTQNARQNGLSAVFYIWNPALAPMGQSLAKCPNSPQLKHFPFGALD